MAQDGPDGLDALVGWLARLAPKARTIVKLTLVGTVSLSDKARLDALLDRILAGRDQPFFCSQFVVYVYQWAAEQSGMSPQAIFSVSDAKASPSVLASKLVGNPHFAEAGYMLPGER